VPQQNTTPDNLPPQIPPGGEIPPEAINGNTAQPAETGQTPKNKNPDKPLTYQEVDVIVLPKGYIKEYKEKHGAKTYPLPETSGPAKIKDSIPLPDIDWNETESPLFILDTGQGTPQLLKLSQVTIAREGVFDYEGRPVYKPASELQAILDHGEGRPITREHPPNGHVTRPDQQLGWIENLAFTDSGELKADLIITDSQLIQEIQDGTRKEVSPGFYADITPTNGEWNGQPYQESQHNMWLDHIAITTRGRCTIDDGCGITDSILKDATTTQTDSPETLIDQAGQTLLDAQDLASLIEDSRRNLIAELTSLTGRPTSDFQDLTLTQLRTARELIQDTQARPAGIGIQDAQQHNTDARKIVDEAYEKIQNKL